MRRIRTPRGVGVVSSVAVVNDEATVDVMVALHAQLRAGAGLADALLAAYLLFRLYASERD